MNNQTLNLADGFEPVSREQWRAAVDNDLAGAPYERRLVTHTDEGVAIQPLYTEHDHPTDADPEGFPAQPRFTRGTTPLGTSRAGWDIRQEFTGPDPDTANAAILDDLAGGVTTAHLRLDLAARNALEPSDPRANDLTGHDGAAIYCLSDLETALKEVRLDIAGVSLEAGAAAFPAAAVLTALANRQDADPSKRRFDFNADPLAVLARDGAHPLGLDRAFADLAELARWNNAHAPNSRAARVGTAPYHHAGATATQDIAYSIATAIVYLRVLTNAGLSVDDAAKQIRFSFAVGCNFFLAAAKLRAARRLWHHTLDACNATDPDARMSMHIKPSKRITTRRDPWINILRNTATTFAASLAGAESITTAPFDDALGDPEDTARRLARNTQLILTEESNLHRVVDPAGGSWFIESLTDELARKAWPLIQHIEHRGGMTEALKSGLIHEQIDSAFRSKEQRIATRKQPITGVTEFPDTAEQIPARPARDHAAIRSAATHRINERSTTPDLHEKLAQLAAADGHARFDAATWAADAGATLDQLIPNRPESAADQITPISPHPYAAPFEALRDAADTRAGAGARPRVFLANLGPLAAHAARANFSQNLFEAGGFQVIKSEPLRTPEQAATAFRNANANIACICSSDDLYQSLVPEIAPALKNAGARTVVLAGHPGKLEQAYRDAGVGRFIFIKCDVLRTLTELLEEEGVLQ